MVRIGERNAAVRPRPAGPPRRRRIERVPVPLLLPAIAGLAFLVLPLAGMVIRAPWGTLWPRLGEPGALTALRLSLQTATIATAVCLTLGVPLAWLLARVEFPGRRVVRALVTVPLVLPPVVGGVALLLVFGRRGLVGAWLDATFGFALPFTTAGVVVAEAFVAMPFLVIAVEGALRGADTRYEEAAATLGAGRWTAFTHVTLPLVAPGIAAGGVLCWARALGEFGATITFAGNYPGITQTMPLAVYQTMESGDLPGAVVLSLILLTVSVTILAALRDKWIPSA
jgi:molybdate transport system permease protein